MSSGGASQRHNSEMVNLLSSELQPRNDPAMAWKTATGAHLSLPGLRAFWPMSAVGHTGAIARDISGNGNHLTPAGGGVTFGCAANSLIPVAVFGGGANQYLALADGGAGNWADITGGETYITSGQRGLTVGGWFYWAAKPGAQQLLIAKNTSAVDRSYDIRIAATDQIQFVVFAGPVIATSAADINAGWNHIVGQFDAASRTVYVYLNGAQTAGVTGAAPATLTDSTATFTIGADGAGTNLFTGSASSCFLSACSISQSIITALFQQTRAMYGV